tara:strand:+ start:1354 stop:1716 length:363 start_codon:yes stop_codon:yes gene_type:complete
LFTHSYLQLLNEELIKSADESRGTAEKLKIEHDTYMAEKENFALAVDGLNDELIAMMSNSLGAHGQQKGYNDPKLDVAVLSAQVNLHLRRRPEICVLNQFSILSEASQAVEGQAAELFRY